MDINFDCLCYLVDVMFVNVNIVYSNEMNICRYIKQANFIVGGVFIVGVKVFNLIICDMFKDMILGIVFVDVVVDQGGCIEICKLIMYENFIFIIDDVVYYCVVNMFGVVFYIFIIVLINVILFYVI